MSDLCKERLASITVGCLLVPAKENPKIVNNLMKWAGEIQKWKGFLRKKHCLGRQAQYLHVTKVCILQEPCLFLKIELLVARWPATEHKALAFEETSTPTHSQLNIMISQDTRVVSKQRTRISRCDQLALFFSVPLKMRCLSCVEGKSPVPYEGWIAPDGYWMLLYHLIRCY